MAPKLVRDLMTVGVATCSTDTPVADVARLMIDTYLEGVVVLDPEDGNALGVITQDELAELYIRLLETEAGEELPGAASLAAYKASDIMHEGLPQCPPDIPLQAAARIMQDQNVRILFMTHHAAGIIYPAAYLTYSHLLRHLVARDEEELKSLGISASRTSPIDAFIKRRDEARKKHNHP